MKLFGGLVFLVGVFFMLAGLMTPRGTFEQCGVGILLCIGGLFVGYFGSRRK